MNKRMLRRAILVGGIVVLAAASYGDPERHIADLIWKNDAAPWEKVTAVYTPDAAEPRKIEISEAVFADVAACRDHVMELAAERGDPDLQKGSFECAVGFYPQRDAEKKTVTGDYRLIVR